MPKTDIKKSESADIKELCDEALDRADGGIAQACNASAGCSPSCFSCALSSSPTE
ncbi:MAG: hypothetical protein ISR48_04640 [Alphaproteobacteria bacterium]|nr:hypothetical protein [Alphaproteobacteria bacterium]